MLKSLLIVLQVSTYFSSNQITDFSYIEAQVLTTWFELIRCVYTKHLFIKYLVSRVFLTYIQNYQRNKISYCFYWVYCSGNLLKYTIKCTILLGKIIALNSKRTVYVYNRNYRVFPQTISSCKYFPSIFSNT
jgi:hypothetical protein